MNTVKIPINNAIRLALYQSIRSVNPTTSLEMRQNNRVFREFDLEDLEAIVAKLPPPGPGPDLLKAHNDAFLAAWDQSAGEGELDVSERAADILRGYWDRLDKLFPEVKNDAGQVVQAAGLPLSISRRLAPLVDALDTAFPVPDKAEATKAA
jgi:hypothetical protein